MNRIASLNTVVMIGNPNTGKSTLFNALTGASQKIANYPGVTVEACIGKVVRDGHSMMLVDLPGTYSMAAHGPDEYVTAKTLTGQAGSVPRPNGVLLVLDACSLDRNLYVATQVLEAGLPTVIALTMVDLAERRGIHVDPVALGQALGVPVVPVNPSRARGLDPLCAALQESLDHPPAPLTIPYPESFGRAVDTLHDELGKLAGPLGYRPARHQALRLLVDRDGPLVEELTATGGDELTTLLQAVRASATNGTSLALQEAGARYGQIRAWTQAARTQREVRRNRLSERVDAIVTHPVAGLTLFAVLMMLVFQSIYLWSAPLMDGVESLVGWVGGGVLGVVPESWTMLRSLLETGVFGGVAGVLVFLPQILILFLLVTVLEDIGYMSRAAFLMDKVMSRVGLSGRSFVPLLSSFACAVPGIMSARGIRDRNTRLATIFLAPFMSCSARLPVYVLFIAAFVPQRTVLGFLSLQGFTLFALYCLGILVAVPTGLVLTRWILRTDAAPFLMELPDYRLPNARNVARVLVRRATAFIKRAGSVILAVAILVWALAYFPRDAAIDQRFDARLGALPAVETATGAPTVDAVQIENARRAAHLSNSYLGRVGRLIEPVVEPLGWDWRIGMAVVASFPAREVIIATMGTIFSLGTEQDESSVGLRDELRRAETPDGQPLCDLATALSLMVFFALCAQCAATLAVMRRETNSWRWPIASFLYMTTLAYVAAFTTYQIATALGA